MLPTGIEVQDVLIEDGRIAGVGAPPTARADDAIDGTGLVLLPGVIDDQVHFREPGLTHKEDLRTGSRACARGGVTTFLDMPNTVPNATTQALLDAKHRLAEASCVVNYGFFIGATPDNVETLAAAERTPGIKIFIGSSTGDLLVDDQDALERIFAETTLPICAHCEDEATVQRNAAALGDDLTVHDHSRIRNAEAAVTATRRACDLARRHRHRFHVLHVSAADEIDILRDHVGLITGEACTHHLLFSTDDYDRLGTRVQMNPALKSPSDVEAMWRALHDGHLQVIATDHAPHTLEEKAQPYPASPSGLPAVENSLALMLDAASKGRCSLEQIAHWMSDAPARVWDMVGKGRIAEGYDADLVLVDLECERRIDDAAQETKSKWSPWHGETLRGWPVRTIVGGETVFMDGTVVDRPMGRAVQFDHARGGYWATAHD